MQSRMQNSFVFCLFIRMHIAYIIYVENVCEEAIQAVVNALEWCDNLRHHDTLERERERR